MATILFSNSSLKAGGYSTMKSFYDLQLNDINGEEVDLIFQRKEDFVGECGFNVVTDQYADLQNLYERMGIN